MLEISVPNTYKAEIEYVAAVLFQDFLGIQFQLHFSETSEYTIKTENSSIVTFSDVFFEKAKTLDSYVNTQCLPENPTYLIEGVPEDFPLPILYGEPIMELDFEKRKAKCSFDPFGAIFFFLTRWEELLIKDKDEHGRPREKKLYAVQHGWTHRAVVNEYVEFIFRLLRNLDSSIQRKSREYRVVLSHDVDHIRRYAKASQLVSALGGDLLLRKKPWLVFNTLLDYSMIKLGLKKDNYDTFEWLMDISDRYQLKSRFYFIPSKHGDEDARYDIHSDEVLAAINVIKKRKHVIGIHGSYNSFNNLSILSKELTLLEEVSGLKIKEGRQHYLRFENPTTWENWDALNLTSDRTVGYYEDIGFRAGVCYDYPVFDIKRRKILKLREFPLCAMEVPLIKKYKTEEAAFQKVMDIIDLCKRYNGNFELLWHPENFNHPFWGKYKGLYERIVAYSKSEHEVHN